MIEREKWELYSEDKKNFNSKCCLSPKSFKINCSKKIVKAHTVPRAKGLKEIARNNHVYSFHSSIEKIENSFSFLKPTSIGINRASTFTGFCSKHDNAIFSPLEKVSFDITNKEQLFLLIYRSFSREFYMKRAQNASTKLYEEFFNATGIVDEFQAYQDSVEAGHSDNLKYKDIIDDMLVKKNFSDVRGYVILFKKTQPIMCSGRFYPEQDFNGNNLQDITNLDIIPSAINITSFYDSSIGGVIVFTWLENENNVCSKFISSLDEIRSTDQHRLTSAILRLFFSHIDNLHISPNWWDDLEEEKKTYLTNRLADSADLQKDRECGYLSEDDIDFIAWEVDKVMKVS